MRPTNYESNTPIPTYAEAKRNVFTRCIDDLKFELNNIKGGSLRNEDKALLKDKMLLTIAKFKM